MSTLLKAEYKYKFILMCMSKSTSVTGSKFPLYCLVRLLAPDYTYTGVGLQAV